MSEQRADRSGLPRLGLSNDQAILKLQYQRNFGTNAFFRIYGYTISLDGPRTTRSR